MVKPKRVSATVPAELVAFLDDYQQAYCINSRSAVLAEAIRALRERELLAAYGELGGVQAYGIEVYPADNSDGFAR